MIKRIFSSLGKVLLGSFLLSGVAAVITLPLYLSYVNNSHYFLLLYVGAFVPALHDLGNGCLKLLRSSERYKRYRANKITEKHIKKLSGRSK